MTERTHEAMQAGLDYDTAAAEAADEITGRLKSAPIILRRMTVHLSKTAGKMIRARVLLACAMKGDGTVGRDAVKAAAAAELMHLATLVHDDIIDDADKRRGIDALHKRYGVKRAVLCGDYLLCAALELAASIKGPAHRRETVAETFPPYMTQICLGEAMQNHNRGNLRLSERTYFKIIGGKTAALFKACFYAGFLLSDEPDDDGELYLQIGDNIGLIFQLADDCADYEATKKRLKKPVLSDFAQGVITLPLIYALKKDGTLRDKIDAGLAPEQLKAAVSAAGGLRYTHKKIRAIHKKTLALTEKLHATPAKNALLTALLDKAAGATI